MEYNIKELGLMGVLMLLFGKVYHKKDEQQNSQNDLLVQNLIESNKVLTEKFDLIIQELRISNSEFIKSNAASNDKLLEEIRENKEFTKKLINLIQNKEEKIQFLDK
ncbi:MAG: hypothetical protein ACRDDH_03685 [Cetobacterium sp.]|uniref:hypothetical protein n=2 Tax=Cetobacterium sp. TaxID=2071632 RepID=UPI003EE4C638